MKEFFNKRNLLKKKKKYKTALVNEAGKLEKNYNTFISINILSVNKILLPRSYSCPNLKKYFNSISNEKITYKYT